MIFIFMGADWGGPMVTGRGAVPNTASPLDRAQPVRSPHCADSPLATTRQAFFWPPSLAVVLRRFTRAQHKRARFSSCVFVVSELRATVAASRGILPQGAVRPSEGFRARAM